MKKEPSKLFTPQKEPTLIAHGLQNSIPDLQYYQRYKNVPIYFNLIRSPDNYHSYAKGNRILVQIKLDKAITGLRTNIAKNYEIVIWFTPQEFKKLLKWIKIWGSPLKKFGIL